MKISILIVKEPFFENEYGLTQNALYKPSFNNLFSLLIRYLIMINQSAIPSLLKNRYFSAAFFRF